jgi:hypothetical protein
LEFAHLGLKYVSGIGTATYALFGVVVVGIYASQGGPVTFLLSRFLSSRFFRHVWLNCILIVYPQMMRSIKCHMVWQMMLVCALCLMPYGVADDAGPSV